MIYCVRMILMHILEISGLVRIQPVKGVSIRYFISISLKRAVSMPGADLMTVSMIIRQSLISAHVYAAYYDADFKETVGIRKREV